MLSVKRVIQLALLYAKNGSGGLRAFLKKPGAGLTLLTPFAFQVGFMKISSSKKHEQFQGLLERLDQLDASYRLDEECSTLQRHLTVSEDEEAYSSAELLWRLARATFQLAQMPNSSQAQQKKLTEEALAHVRRSLRLNPKNPNAHKWCAVILEAANYFRSIPEQAAGASLIRAHLEQALKHQPKDAMTHFSLAVWSYNIARLTWIERFVARNLCSSFPESTFEFALERFDEGDAICPRAASCRHLLTAAQCCIGLGLNDRAQLLLRRAADLPARTQEDQQALKEVKRILGNIQTG